MNTDEITTRYRAAWDRAIERFEAAMAEPNRRMRAAYAAPAPRPLLEAQLEWTAEHQAASYQRQRETDAALAEACEARGLPVPTWCVPLIATRRAAGASE